MVKLDVFNMENFLQTVNTCSGAVNLLCTNGKAENINKQYIIQHRLLQEHIENNRCSRLALEISNPKDYMRIVYFTMGDA